MKPLEHMKRRQTAAFAVASPNFALGKYWPVSMPPDGELSVYELDRHNDSGITPFKDPGRCISSMSGAMWPSSE